MAEELVIWMRPNQPAEDKALLRMITGLGTVSEGGMRIGGRVVNRVAPTDRDIAMVCQKVEQVGAPLDLFDGPANMFVAAFIALRQ